MSIREIRYADYGREMTTSNGSVGLAILRATENNWEKIPVICLSMLSHIDSRYSTGKVFEEYSSTLIDRDERKFTKVWGYVAATEAARVNKPLSED